MVELVKDKNNSYENPFLSDDDNGVFKDNIQEQQPVNEAKKLK